MFKTLLLLSLCSYCFAGFNFASYNIRNFDYDDRSKISTDKSELASTIYNLDTDLIAVQEIVEKEIFKTFIQRNFPDHEVVLSECGGHHGQHLGFVYNTKKFKLLHFTEDLRIGMNGCHSGSRPATIGLFQVIDQTNPQYGLDFIAMSLHLKSGGNDKSIAKRQKQLRLLTDLINELKNLGHENFIIMGDLNTTEYNKGNHHYDFFVQFVEANNLYDLSAHLNCTSYWWGGINDGIEYASLLDHVMVSNGLFEFLNIRDVQSKGHCEQVACNSASADILGSVFTNVSDHCPVVAYAR